MQAYSRLKYLCSCIGFPEFLPFCIRFPQISSNEWLNWNVLDDNTRALKKIELRAQHRCVFKTDGKGKRRGRVIEVKEGKWQDLLYICVQLIKGGQRCVAFHLTWVERESSVEISVLCAGGIWHLCTVEKQDCGRKWALIIWMLECQERTTQTAL